MSRKIRGVDKTTWTIVGILCAAPLYVIIYGIKLISTAIGCIFNQNSYPKRKYITQDLYGVDCMDGYDFEHFVANLLSKNGYTNIVVTQASGDYGVDIVCDFFGTKYAFQCKHYSKNVGVKSIQEVYAGMKHYGADVGAVITNSYYTENAKQLARETGVVLYDRDRLNVMIKNAKNQKNISKERIIKNDIPNSNANKNNLLIIIPSVLIFSVLCGLLYPQDTNADSDDTIAPEHKWVGVNGYSATCTEDWYILESCSVCKETRKNVIEKSKGHQMRVISYRSPTYEKDGERVSSCTVCGYKNTEKIDKLKTLTLE